MRKLKKLLWAVIATFCISLLQLSFVSASTTLQPSSMDQVVLTIQEYNVLMNNLTMLEQNNIKQLNQINRLEQALNTVSISTQTASEQLVEAKTELQIAKDNLKQQQQELIQSKMLLQMQSEQLQKAQISLAKANQYLEEQEKELKKANQRIRNRNWIITGLILGIGVSIVK